MRKYFIILFLFIYTTCAGQSFNSGIKLGINTAQVNGDDMGGFNKLGAVGGIFVNYPFSDVIKGQMEMQFSQKGSRRALVNGVYQSGKWDRLHLDYFEVPLLLIIKLTERIDIQAGLGAAYLFGYRFRPLYGSAHIDFLKKYEVNMAGGASYRFSDRMSVYGRYSQSILPINYLDNSQPSQLFGQGDFNIVASFGLMYSFNEE